MKTIYLTCTKPPHQTLNFKSRDADSWNLALINANAVRREHFVKGFDEKIIDLSSGVLETVHIDLLCLMPQPLTAAGNMALLRSASDWIRNAGAVPLPA